jgi:ABC-type uncharacterized transport system substrate-binding protein
MRRRNFITLFCGAAAAWPLAVHTQPPTRLPTIGILGSGTPEVQGRWWAAFVERLRVLGWIEGRNIAIAYRWAEGRSERYTDIAAEFVRLNVEIIVTEGGTAVAAAKRATPVIPIVFAAAGDPVGTGLVASLARPGGNVTGLSIQQTDIATKRLELLREVVPRLRRLAILANIGSTGAVQEMNEVEATIRTLGLEATKLQIRSAEDIVPGFNEIMGRTDALYVVLDPLINTNRIHINSLALGARLPTIHTHEGLVEAGGLMSYGPNFVEMHRRAAELVDKILRGATPGDIPVEQPTKFELAINLKTAKALGLSVPPTVLARADEVIE